MPHDDTSIFVNYTFFKKGGIKYWKVDCLCYFPLRIFRVLLEEHCNFSPTNLFCCVEYSL